MNSKECSADRSRCFLSLMQQCPAAEARLIGSSRCPNIHGTVCFYQTNYGVLVKAQICGLPLPDKCCRSPVFAFHIHEGTSCTDNQTGDTFAGSKGHYNPRQCAHPCHAGDLPPLFGNNGYAFSLFLTDRFSVQEVIGKTVIIHRNPDDFTTQPSGNAGDKIACGVIEQRCSS